jgi:hypothetical protein
VGELGPGYAAVIDDAGATYERIAGHYGLVYRPLPAIVEITAVARQGNHPALLVESPEPLDPARVKLVVKELEAGGSGQKRRPMVMVANGDYTRFLLFREAQTDVLRPWQPGTYRLEWTFAGDIGPEALVLKRGGTAVQETVEIEVVLQ